MRISDWSSDVCSSDLIGQITRLQQLKTGALIAFACESGAIMGCAQNPAHEALRGYAHDLGLAFQIADDLLDVEGNAEEMGKAVRKDEAAGKATFVSILGIDRHRDQAVRLAEPAGRTDERRGGKKGGRRWR